MRPLAISFVANGFPPEVGGTELYNGEYALRLHQRGHRVAVFSWEPRHVGPGEAGESPPFEVRREPRFERRGRILPGGLDAALAEWHPDVVFLSRGSRKLERVARVAAAHAPLVVGMHELGRRPRRGALGAWRLRRRYGLDRAARVTVNSLDTRDRVLAAGVDPERIALVHPGVDLRHFTPDPDAGAQLRRELGLEGRPLLLTVSRLAANKGHERVLRVLPSLLARFSGLAWLVVGEGAERSRLEALARELGVAEAVHFSGRVADTRAWYNACDVFVMPSGRAGERAKAGEGFGIGYVEAGACARPSIASELGGARDCVVDGETGRRVDPSDEAALEAAIAELLADPQRARALGEGARKYVQRFDWEHGTNALEQALREAARP